MTGSVAAQPFDLDISRNTVWPTHLMPHGEGERFDKEPFNHWWSRVKGELGHLPATLCEQWIYRHWLASPFRFLPHDSLAWPSVTPSSEALLARVYRAWGGELDARFDYDVFQHCGGDDRRTAAKALDDGRRDYPLVVLARPHGIQNESDIHYAVRWVIVEGHQRHRCLPALHALGQAPGRPHAIYIISSPTIDSASPRLATSPKPASIVGNDA